MVYKMSGSLTDLKDNLDSLDGYIRDNILYLNECGIKTLWCCSGIVEDHPNGFPHRGIFIRPKKKELYKAAYLVLERNEKLPLVHGWVKKDSNLLAGPCVEYRIEDLLGDNWEDNDIKVKKLWDRLFDFILEYTVNHH